MDGTARYGSSSSSFESATRWGKPVATQGKSEQKQTDPGMDDWELMEGDDDWEFVPNQQVLSDQKRADPDDEEWELVEHPGALTIAHKLATSPGNVNGSWATVDPSVSPADAGIDMDDASHGGMKDPLAYLQRFISEDALDDTPDVIQLRTALRSAHAEYNDLMREAKESNQDLCSREMLFNFLSGANAFLMCFGAGTLTSSAVGMPVVGWGMSTLLWALTERFSPMIRNTTWSNPHADKTYPLLGNLIEQAARNLVRRIGGMQPHQYADNQNASDGSDDVRLSDIGVTGFLKAWLGKMSTEDLPYYFYTLCYGTRYSIIARMNLPATSFASLFTLLVAGTLAGASTATTTHFLRRQLHNSSGQRITKTMAIWKKELTILDLHRQLLVASINTPGISRELVGVKEREKAALNKLINQAVQKSQLPSSLWFEMRAMFNVKRGIGDQRGEVAGKLAEFVAGLLAKGSVLGISTGWNYGFTTPMLQATASASGKIGIMWGQYGMLIFAFNARKEFELAYRGVLGLGLGTRDVFLETFPCLQIPIREDAENLGPKPGLPSMNSTAELMADYKERTNLGKKAPKHRGTMDGGDEDVNGDDNDNRVTRRNMVDERVDANRLKSEKSAAPSRKQGRGSSRNVSENTGHASKADVAETVDEGTGPTSPARKVKNLVNESLDISDSSESSE
ncbi:hypothetical protein ABC383_12380 [Noviherbaspirillum sp. 1P10PC]|uniref:hypothetical protein n=1 Tax=Noviherbaspirillum sp. 1P10PC TaxID=3132292 RepID=UPI00399FA32C